MANVQTLHATPPTPARSPERQKLADAIERHAEITGYLNRLAAARARIGEQSLAAFQVLDRAIETLRVAREDEGHHRVRELLGEADPNEITVEAATAAVREAEREREKIDLTSVALSEQGTDAERRLRYVEDHVKSAISTIVRDIPGVTQLLQEFDAARNRVAALKVTLELLNSASINGLPASAKHWYADRLSTPSHSVLAPWRDALAALATDPDSTLPGDDPLPGEAA